MKLLTYYTIASLSGWYYVKWIRPPQYLIEENDETSTDSAEVSQEFLLKHPDAVQLTKAAFARTAEELERQYQAEMARLQAWNNQQTIKCIYHDECQGQGKHQCPKCKKWYCDECREMWLPIDNQTWVQTAMMCAQCHYNTYGRLRHE